MIESELRLVARDFWANVGDPEPFPRSLESSILWALPVAVLKVSRLSVGAVQTWLSRRGVPLHLECHDRSLRGCVVSYAGKGIILLDGDDSEDERRFTMAHETSHFLLDYLTPRCRAISRLGSCIVEVLDGHRPPTLEERVSALLGGVPVGIHAHLMGRSSNGGTTQARILAIENRADRLALELLAPEAEVKRRIVDLEHPATYQRGVEQTTRVLAEDFGLPLGVAEGYGMALSRSWHAGPSFREWLGR